MARKKLRLSDVFEPIELDLEGPKFLLRSPTRSLEEKLEAWNEKVEELEADDEKFDRDAQVVALIEVVDLQLEPSEVLEGETKSSAKTVLSKLYKDDKIGKGTIEVLIEQLATLRSEDRPISAPRS